MGTHNRSSATPRRRSSRCDKSPPHPAFHPPSRQDSVSRLQQLQQPPHSTKSPNLPFGRFEFQHCFAWEPLQFRPNRQHYRLRLPSLHHGSPVNMAPTISIPEPFGIQRSESQQQREQQQSGLCSVRQPAPQSTCSATLY